MRTMTEGEVSGSLRAESAVNLYIGLHGCKYARHGGKNEVERRGMSG